MKNWICYFRVFGEYMENLICYFRVVGEYVENWICYFRGIGKRAGNGEKKSPCRGKGRGDWGTAGERVGQVFMPPQTWIVWPVT